MTPPAEGLIFCGMAHRFHVQKIGDAERVPLDAGTIRHLHVLGIQEGGEVVLFDGTNREFHARIENLSASSASAVILRRSDAGRDPSVQLTLACAVPKGRRMDTLVRMCAELGVRRIIPLLTCRSVVRPTEGDDSSNKLARWRKICAAASEQSHRNLVTSVDPPAKLEDVLSRAGSFDLAVILSPDEADAALSDALGARSRFASLLLLVGPEGGFTREEIELAARHGVRSARLTRSILRVETACVAAAAVALTTLSQ